MRPHIVSRPPSPWVEQIVAHQVDRVRAANAELLLILPPMLSMASEVRALADAGYIPYRFLYNDPVKFPSLYDTDLYFDYAHLNAEGAEVFTRQLATDVADQLDAIAKQRLD